MKKLYLAVLMAVIAFAAPGSATPALTAVGQVSYAIGSTFVVRNGETSALRSNDIVYSLDKIITADSGRLKLSMNDGSTLFIARNSQISIDHYIVKYGYRISGLFNMIKGKIRFIVTKIKGLDADFLVQTRSAIIGVKGTDFTVIEAKGATQVMLHSGKIVADTKHGSHVIKPGTVARIVAGGDIAIRNITPQDINLLGVAVEGFGGKQAVAGVGAVKSLSGTNVKMKSVVVSKVHAPKVHVPKVHAPKVHVPKVHAPKVHVPKVHIPKVKLSKVHPPKP